jgi:hypothetical protein
MKRNPSGESLAGFLLYTHVTLELESCVVGAGQK